MLIIVLTNTPFRIIHDIDHPGFNNAYQINAKTELALIYNDQSPLENHHCAVGFTVLRNPDCNIFKNLTEKEYETVRKGMIRCVLSTDLTKHGEIMGKFKAVAENFNYADPEHRAQVCKSAL
jgi:high affinity cGMP-specific 3',5'-cyclic phosphodiesterase 9